MRDNNMYDAANIRSLKNSSTIDDNCSFQTAKAINKVYGLKCQHYKRKCKFYVSKFLLASYY